MSHAIEVENVADLPPAKMLRQSTIAPTPNRYLYDSSTRWSWRRPISAAANSGVLGHNGAIPDVSQLRIPLKYLANLLTAGDEAPASEDEYAGGPDDALGLYLRQMGSIPLLTRDKELALAKKLEHHRNRFRAAALLCPRPLTRVLEKFEQIAAAPNTRLVVVPMESSGLAGGIVQAMIIEALSVGLMITAYYMLSRASAAASGVEISS